MSGPASAVVASMMRFGWQVLSGTEFGTHKGAPNFASMGHGELRAVLQDAYDRWTCERASNRLPALALVGGPPLALLHSNSSCSSCAHRGTLGTARVAVCFLGHDAHGQLGMVGVGSLWHRCYQCPASAEFRRGFCQDFDLGSWLDRMPLSEMAGMLWTRLMLADPSYRQDAPKPWEVHPENGELDNRGFGDGSLKHGRVKRLARWSWGLARPRSLASTKETTLAERVAFLWFLRHVSALGGTFHTDSLNVHRRWTRGLEYSTQGSSSLRQPGDGSGSASTRSEHTSLRWNG